MTVLENWATESNLALNEIKTKQMLIATSKISRAHELDTVVPDIRVKAQTLEKVDEFKLLGTWSKSRYYKEGNVQSKKCQAIRR